MKHFWLQPAARKFEPTLEVIGGQMLPEGTAFRYIAPTIFMFQMEGKAVHATLLPGFLCVLFQWKCRGVNSCSKYACVTTFESNT